MQPEWQGSATDYLARQQGSGPQPMGPQPQQMGAPSPAMQAPGADSLGGVVGQAQDPGSPMAQFNQMMQLTMRAYAPAMRPMIPSDTGFAGVLKNILTGGAHQGYINAYNTRVAEQNAQIRAKAAEKAFDLMSDQQQIAALGGRQQMAMLGMQLRMLGLENQMRDSQLQEAQRQYQREFGTTLPMEPQTPEDRAAMVDEGWTRQPVPGMPNRFRYVRGGGGAAPPPAAPTADDGAPSPDAAALGGGKGRAALDAARAARDAAKARQEQADKPLEGETQKVVSGLSEMRDLIQQALTQFTPEERRQFVGVLRNPALRARQLVQTNPRFQEWQALVGKMQDYKFAKGGANLTKQEIATVEQYLPTGKEWGGGDEFDVKARRFYGTAKGHIEARLGAAKGKTTLERDWSKEPTEVPGTTGGTDVESILKKHGY